MDGARLGYVIYNNQQPSEKLLERYAHDGEYPVLFNEADFADKPYKAYGCDLVAKHVVTGYSKADPILAVRSFIRHDSDKVASEIIRIYRRHQEGE